MVSQYPRPSRLSLSIPKQSSKTIKHVVKDIFGKTAGGFGEPSSPVETFEVVGKNCAAHWQTWG
jgi:hypothetical protein